MSDSVKAWHEMQEENKEIIHADESAKYIFLLDFNELYLILIDFGSKK